jgi:hypothetical protein
VHICPPFSIKSTLQPEEPKKDDPYKVNPVRNSSGALNPAGIIVKSNPTAE